MTQADAWMREAAARITELEADRHALKRENTSLRGELANIGIQMQEYCRIHDRPCELGLPSFALLYARVADVVADVRRLEAENARLREAGNQLAEAGFNLGAITAILHGHGEDADCMKQMRAALAAWAALSGGPT